MAPAFASLTKKRYSPARSKTGHSSECQPLVTWCAFAASMS
jgi:hypothetical protein